MFDPLVVLGVLAAIIVGAAYGLSRLGLALMGPKRREARPRLSLSVALLPVFAGALLAAAVAGWLIFANMPAPAKDVYEAVFDEPPGPCVEDLKISGRRLGPFRLSFREACDFSARQARILGSDADALDELAELEEERSPRYLRERQSAEGYLRTETRTDWRPLDCPDAQITVNRVAGGWNHFIVVRCARSKTWFVLAYPPTY